MNNIEFSSQELVALSKAIYYLKYECEEYNALKFAGSPFIGSAYKKIYESSIKALYGEETSNHSLSSIEKVGLHNQIKAIKEKIILFIDSPKEWRNLSFDEKRNLILDFIIPLNYQENTVTDIINSIDQHYGLVT